MAQTASKSEGDSVSTKKRRFRFWGGGGSKRKTSNQLTATAAAAAVSNVHTTSPKHGTAVPTKSILKKEDAAATGRKIPKSITTTQRDAPTAGNNDDDEQAARGGWLTRSKRFRKMCDSAFAGVDADGSNSIDEKELYSGLLLIHLKLGTYAGPAACRPLGRERCHAIFVKMDADESGHLDKDEFQKVMSVLFGNVVLRVIAQWSLTLMIVPLVSQRLLDGIYWVLYTLMNIDDYTTLDEAAMLSLEEGTAWTVRHMPGSMLSVYNSTRDMISTIHTPTLLVSLYDKIADTLDKVPESVWNTVPLTLLSTILGILVVPWIIFKIDDLFQYLADREGAKAKATLPNKTKQLAK